MDFAVKIVEKQPNIAEKSHRPETMIVGTCEQEENQSSLVQYLVQFGPNSGRAQLEAY